MQPLKDLLQPPHRPVAPVTDPAVIEALLDGLRLVDAAAPGAQLPPGLGLHPGFLERLAGGIWPLAAAHREEIRRRAPDLAERLPTLRAADTALALRQRAKLLLCPFTNAWTTTTRALGYEAFWHGDQGGACVVLQSSDPSYAGDDAAWLLPAEGVVLYQGERLHPAVLRDWLRELLAGLLATPAAVAAHLRRSGPPAQVALVETQVPHFGHYVWNALSAWPWLLETPGLPRPDAYVTWESNRFIAPVPALFPDEAGRPLHRLAEPAALTGWLAARDCLALVAKEREVPPGLGPRVAAWAWRHAPEAPAAALRALWAGGRPLVLLGLRLGNRVWLEQEEGLVALAAAIQAAHPRAGFILDGLSDDVTMGWTHDLMSLDAERALAARIAGRIRAFAPCHVAVGGSMAESLLACALMDCFIGPAGSAMAKYKWLANKPGLVLGNSAVLDRTDRDGEACRVFEAFRHGLQPSAWPAAALARDVPVPARPGRMHADYHLDWRALLPPVLALAAEAAG